MVHVPGSLPGVGTNINPILSTGKPCLREVKCQVKGHTANTWRSLDSHPGHLAAETLPDDSSLLYYFFIIIFITTTIIIIITENFT